MKPSLRNFRYTMVKIMTKVSYTTEHFYLVSVIDC